MHRFRARRARTLSRIRSFFLGASQRDLLGAWGGFVARRQRLRAAVRAAGLRLARVLWSRALVTWRVALAAGGR